MPYPLITIIMPFLDRIRYLPQAVDSLRAQSIEDWELVAVDGGSQDGARELFEQYAKADSRVRIFENPRGGIAVNRNFALARARGEFVAILDSDDVAHPMRLEKQLTYLKANSGLLGIGTNFDFIDGDGSLLQLDKYKQRLTDLSELRQRQREGWSCFMHTSMLIRLSALETIGGYRTAFRLAEDDDLFLRLLDMGDLGNMSESLVYYRWHGGNTTGSLDSLIHRAVALASAHLRMANLQDPLESRVEAINYPFFLELQSALAEKSIPIWLMWIGMLQHYRLGDDELLEHAWRNVLRFPLTEQYEAETRRHWRRFCEEFAELRGKAYFQASLLAKELSL